MKYLNIFFATAIVAVLFAGCSKEKKLERKLNNSVWDIQSATVVFYEDNVLTATVSPAFSGTSNFTFFKDGSGTIQYTIVGDSSYYYNMTWTNEEGVVFINIGGGVEQYDVINEDKKSLTLLYTYNYTDGTTLFRDEYTWNLLRD